MEEKLNTPWQVHLRQYEIKEKETEGRRLCLAEWACAANKSYAGPVGLQPLLWWVTTVLPISNLEGLHLVGLCPRAKSQPRGNACRGHGSCQLIIDTSISAHRHISYRFVHSIILHPITKDNFNQSTGLYCIRFFFAKALEVSTNKCGKYLSCGATSSCSAGPTTHQYAIIAHVSPPCKCETSQETKQLSTSN